MGRSSSAFLGIALALFTLTPAVSGIVAPPAVLPASVSLTPISVGLSMPLLVTHAGDGSGRIFTVEQRGLVKVVGDPTPYLDIRSKVACCGERGLLGVAFAPDFESSGSLYVSYSRAGDGAHILERLTVAQPATGRPPTTGQVLIALSDPFSNHNGGHVAFGPDGYLYLAFGDGGSADDPQQNGQNTQVLLGKLLRLDVSGPGAYSIPSDNPFVAGGGRAEIWAYGLRNPWRFSFDPVGGDLWIGTSART